MNTGASLLSLDRLVDDPALADTLDREMSAEVLGRLLRVGGSVLVRFVAHVLQECQARNFKPDRLLSLKEVSAILKRSPQSISLGWRKGRYPFMLKDGAHLVGSQDGLERWIKNRTQSPRHSQLEN